MKILRLHLKANQANLVLVGEPVTATAMEVEKNVRQDVLIIGLVMVYVMIRALTLLVTMMMVTATLLRQLIFSQHLCQLCRLVFVLKECVI